MLEFVFQPAFFEQIVAVFAYGSEAGQARTTPQTALQHQPLSRGQLDTSMVADDTCDAREVLLAEG